MPPDDRSLPSQPPDTDAPAASEGLVIVEDDGRRHIWDEPKHVRRLLGFVFLTALGLLLLDILFLLHRPHKHLSFGEGVFPQENWFGFYPLYGFVASAVMAALALVWRKIVRRSEEDDDR